MVSLRALVLAKDTAEPIRSLMDTNVVSVGTTTDQEDVSNLFEKYGFLDDGGGALAARVAARIGQHRDIGGQHSNGGQRAFIPS